MSRSRRKTPIFGNTTCRSEKEDKKIANQQLRARVRDALITEEEVMPAVREVSNVWSFGKDGKNYWKDAPKKAMRK